MRNVELDVVVTPDGLRALGAFAGTPLTAISPLSGGGPPTGPAARASLVDAGILDSAGAVAPAAQSAIRALASASAYGGLLYAAGPIAFESAAYFDGDRDVSVTPTEGGLRITSPSRLTSWLPDALSQIGRGSARAADVDVSLSAGEALALFATIDLRRRQLLAAMGGAAPSGVCDLADVLDWIAHVPQAPQWLTAQLRATLGGPAPERDEVEAALTTLVRARLLSRTDRGYGLAAEAERLATAMSLVHGVVSISAARIGDDGVPVRVEIRVAQGGPSAFLLYEPDEHGGVSVTCVAADHVLALATRLTTDGSALRAFAERISPHGPAASAFCTTCGAPWRDGARYCGACGAPHGE